MHDKLHIKTAHTGKVLSSVSIELQFIRTSVHATHDAWPCCVCVWKGAVMTARCVVAKSGLLCPSNDRDEKKSPLHNTGAIHTAAHTHTNKHLHSSHTWENRDVSKDTLPPPTCPIYISKFTCPLQQLQRPEHRTESREHRKPLTLH